MLKEIKGPVANRLRTAGRGHILEIVRRHEGGNVGIDDVQPISPQEALVAGINKYHLPEATARLFAEPAIEDMVVLKRNNSR